MKRKFLFDIFVNKGLKISQISVKYDETYAAGNMCIIACDVNTFAKFLWWAVNSGAYKGIYVTLRPFINCRTNQGRPRRWKRDFLMDCFYLNNILIQFYFPFTNRKGKNLFRRHFKYYFDLRFLY